MPTLDRPERPDSSPNGGFFIQSTAGRAGNYEVVIPWPDGGLAHFARDNDAHDLPWHGPTIFGTTSARYAGVSLIESDFKAFGQPSLKNFEVIAVNDDNDIEHWWRENGGEFSWHQAPTLPILPAKGVPALASTGAVFLEDDFGLGITPDRDAHAPSRFYVAAIFPEKGLGIVKRENAAGGPGPWESIEDLLSTTRPHPRVADNFGDADPADSTPFTGGIGLALTTMNAAGGDGNSSLYAGWRAMRENGDMSGDILAAAVSNEGALNIYFLSVDTGHIWDGTSLKLPNDPKPCRGRAAILQSNYGVDEAGGFFIGMLLDRKEYGNFEVIAPAKDGGLLYFWRMNDHREHRPLREGWTFQDRFGDALYDEVSLIQSSYGSDDHCTLELVARRHDQRGFDFFWREPDRVWRGPFVVAGEPTGVVQQPLSASDILTDLRNIGISYTVSEVAIRSWLDNPTFTPYPSIAAALLQLLRGRRLRREIPIDELRQIYEEGRRMPSPRKPEDVNLSVLTEAIVDNFNSRYGETAASLADITTA
ncbi:hypothetical protein H7J86_31940 [Mycobacterium hackensackense]|uniref:hypothetical protein n=1 Tax=Mycobacterium hackensackense TaxID=228909 RepID=UPI002265A24E|nr:hypothetical protein [Mycobacterium hackensackense]MCV7256798.1 hypothetical protein [Mycobacterium hackensackense]